MDESAQTPPSPPAGAQPPRKGSRLLTTVLATASVLALGIAASTWISTSREINRLRQEIANLQDNDRELAAAFAQGRREGSAVGQIIDVASAPARGRDDAVVTLVEFSDYECPFCIRHFQQTMPQIDKNYIQTGKIRYAFRDFPIDQNHPQAIRAHEAARCALEQNKFWDLHPRLFSAPGTHTPIALEERAKEAGLDDAAFRACIASGRTTREIRDTEGIVESLGATGTPWFFVGLRDLKTNKLRILKSLGGAQPYEEFSGALDAALRESAPR